MQKQTCFLNKVFSFFQDEDISRRKKCFLIIYSLLFSLAWSELIILLSPKLISWGLNLQLIFIVAVIVFFLFYCQKIISIQKIRNKFSWIFYIYFTLITSPFFILFKTTLLEPTKPFRSILFFQDIGIMWISAHSEMNIFPLILSVGISAIALLLYYFTEPKNYINQPRRFSSSAIAKKNDNLGFKDSAEKLAINIKALNNPVNVVSVCGEFGEGKSSYVRMVVESLEQEETLYTYVSLTETNEAKGFSKLFSERWMSTLKERYLIFDGMSILKIMGLIFKESPSRMAECGSWFFYQLLKPFQTKIVVSALHYQKQIESVDISILFGNITTIDETCWIIVIDEIERATLDEIYRVIETIERFKNESFTGFPIKLIFILCFARDAFETLLDKEEVDYKALLIKDFFFNDPKSIDLLEFLPPLTQNQKKEFIIEKLKNICNEQNVYQEITWGERLYFNQMIYDRFIEDDQHFEQVYMEITSSSPRIIYKSIEALAFTIKALKNSVFELKADNLGRLSELFLMEYIKIKYPEVYTFLRTATNIFRENEASLIQYTKLSQSEIDEKGKNCKELLKWMRDSSLFKKEFYKQNEEKYQRLIILISYCFSSLNSDDILYDNPTLSDKNNFIQYFIYTSTSNFERTLQLFRSEKALIKHYPEQWEEMKNSQLEKADVSTFANYLTAINNKRISLEKLMIRAVNEIFRRVHNKSAINEIILRKAIELIRWVIYPDNELDETERKKFTEKFKKKLSGLFKSRTVLPYVQYKLIEEFKKKDTDETDLVRKLDQLIFSKIEALHAIQRVRKKYFTEKYDIYENGKYASYVLYESWSEDDKEIPEIQSIAKRNLAEYPDLIEAYWDVYNIDRWTFDDFKEHDHKSKQIICALLCMPPDKLQEINQKNAAKDIVEDYVKNKRSIKLKYDKHTLYAFYNLSVENCIKM